MFPIVIILAILSLIAAESSRAQVTAIPGPGNLGTQVNHVGNVYEITQGTRAGSNLFHNFGEFSIAAAETARFQTTTLMPDATIGNILGRVGGGNPSSLFGTIDSISYYPGANLFLMNPAGIVFGPTAVLNVGGSVHFTTGDYLRLSDGVRFEAVPSVQDGLLSTASVDAFGFLGASPSAITVRGSQLAVANGNSLSLIGGDITIAPDPDSGAPSALMAPSGQISLVSAASPGEVLLPNLATGPNINGQTFSTMGAVSISGGSTLDVSDNAFAGDGSGGTVRILGGRFVMESSFIFANTFAEAHGAPTAVKVDMTHDITLGSGSGISAFAAGSGRVGDVDITGTDVRLEGGSFVTALAAESVEQGGNISVSSRSLSLANGSSLFTGSFGGSSAGNITISATDSLNVSGFDPVFGTGTTIESVAFAGGNSGAVTVQSPHIIVSELGKIGTTSVGTGYAGNLTIQTGVLEVLGGGSIASSGGNGSGSITITANDVTVKGFADPFQRSRIVNSGGGDGGTGDIHINTDRLLLTDDARMNMDGAGQLGTIMIAANESVTISNGGKLRMENEAGPGGRIELSSPQVTIDQGIIQTLTVGPGNAGALMIAAADVRIAGGQINSGSCPASCGDAGGLGGDVTITAQNSVHISGRFAERNVGGQIDRAGPAGIFAVTAASGGTAGNIQVMAPLVGITDGAQLSATSSGSGAAGSVTVQGTASPAQSIHIDGFGSGLFTETQGTGKGGDITAWASQVQLTNGATISSKTTGSGNAGNILVNADAFNMNSGATITAASTGSGNAGTVTIQGTASPAVTVVIDGTGTGIFTSTADTGIGGNITLTANEAQLSNGGTISASSTGTMAGAGNAGNVAIAVSGDFQSNGGIVRTTAAHGLGGDVLITAGQDIRLNNSASVSSSSTGPGNAGNITTIAGDDFVMQNSSMTTQATQASGGNIKIGAQDQIVLQNSLVSASVMGGEGSGGNISIDPIVVILQNSQVLAQAVLGNGGNITIITPLFLADQSSLVSASSQFGLSGTVNIQSPTSNLAGTVSSLPSSLRQAQSFQTGRCAALADSRSSSLIVAGRDILPAEPGGWSPSPFALMGEETDSLASASPPVAAMIASADAPISLRRLTPAGFLTQSFAENGLTGCRA